ncbi:MAG: RNA-binding S4 domain-containing protein [Syntrophales bacterium]|nr:RNA-binding S4 domain-containing protein [Syntrophales bacterium]
MKEKENEVRLQKILSRAGIASRRKAEELIREGRVTVNGRIVRELGSKVKEDDLVKVDGIAVSIPKRYRYFMVYKPRGFVTTMKDPQGVPRWQNCFRRYRSAYSRSDVWISIPKVCFL